MSAATEYTIDELARTADTTVRSVRVYHERGLLPAPEVRGRIGYYSQEHLGRGNNTTCCHSQRWGHESAS